jgi:hypothetical protein
MTTPGWQNQQALHRATQAAQAGSRGRKRHGGFGVVGRLIGAIVSLAVVGFAIGVFAMIMHSVDPNWFAHVSSWVSSLF